MMTYKNILISKKDEIGIITINRPKKYNALNLETETEIGAAFDELVPRLISSVSDNGKIKLQFYA